MIQACPEHMDALCNQVQSRWQGAVSRPRAGAKEDGRAQARVGLQSRMAHSAAAHIHMRDSIYAHGKTMIRSRIQALVCSAT